MKEGDLIEIVGNLIGERKEGSYWDYKEKPYNSSLDFVHDVLCFSNCPNGKDAYIIIGVSDEGQIKGLEENEPNRKSLNEYYDILKNSSFANSIPTIDLTTIKINSRELDIITIKDCPLKKPYSLSKEKRENKKRIIPNAIYSRIGDTNSKINESAPFYIQEQIWKERFLLNLSGKDKLKEFLKNPDDWEVEPKHENRGYHKLHPEYRFEIGESEFHQETYSFFFDNSRSYKKSIEFFQNQTLIYKDYLIYLDEMRLQIVYPEIHDMEKRKIRKEKGEKFRSFYYFDLSTIKGGILRLLENYQEKYFRHGEPFCPPFIFLKDESDKINFIDKINTDPNFKKIESSYTQEEWEDLFEYNTRFNIPFLYRVCRYWYSHYRTNDLNRFLYFNPFY